MILNPEIWKWLVFSKHPINKKHWHTSSKLNTTKWGGIYIHIHSAKQAPLLRLSFFDFDEKKDRWFWLWPKFKCAKRIWKMKHRETIYFGGGTPDVLTSENWFLISAVYENCCRQTGNYWSNPDDLSTEEFLNCQSKINRLSIGIQSFEDDLRMMVIIGGSPNVWKRRPVFW
jgi:hypothetical protein